MSIKYMLGCNYWGADHGTDMWRHYDPVRIREEMKQLIGELEKKYPNLTVIRWEGLFNYPAINNFGRKAAKGDCILLLNNDVEVLTPGWLREMTPLAMQPGVGGVGALLGAPFGLGSVAVLVLQASMFQFACWVCRYEPRAVEHENFLDTVKRWKKRWFL